MNDDRNRSQIIRIDARNCFVESLNDAFEIGKAHFTFASYDLSKPSGQRQTNSIQIYIDMAEVLELCRKLMGGELRYLMQAKDVISYPTDYSILCHIAKLVNEGFYQDGGRIRGVPVTIGGTSYIPPLPIESIVKENIEAILADSIPSDEKAITLCLYCMKAQIFNDGNKRASVIFANHYMISQGAGMIIIPEKEVPEFKRLLVAYYEDKDTSEIMDFMRSKCIKTF